LTTVEQNYTKEVNSPWRMCSRQTGIYTRCICLLLHNPRCNTTEANDALL